MKCGQVLIVDYPFTDHSASKLRPAIVLSADSYNGRDDFIVAPISSRPDTNDSNVFQLDASQPYFAATRLKPQSRYIRWSKLMTITSRVVRRSLGVLPEPQLAEIRQSVRTIFE
jgi:mRNA interferase MazF